MGLGTRSYVKIFSILILQQVQILGSPIDLSLLKELYFFLISCMFVIFPLSSPWINLHLNSSFSVVEKVCYARQPYWGQKSHRAMLVGIGITVQGCPISFSQ